MNWTGEHLGKIRLCSLDLHKKANQFLFLKLSNLSNSKISFLFTILQLSVLVNMEMCEEGSVLVHYLCKHMTSSPKTITCHNYYQNRNRLQT